MTEATALLAALKASASFLEPLAGNLGWDNLAWAGQSYGFNTQRQRGVVVHPPVVTEVYPTYGTPMRLQPNRSCSERQ